MQTYETLIDLIVSRRDEELKGITFILGQNDEHFVSYKELYNNALRLLNGFVEAGFKTGDEVIFQIDSNREFVFAFWACILGGMIPVPVTTGTNDEHKLKLFKIWNILDNPKMLATKDFLARLLSFGEKNGLADEINAIKDRTISPDSINLKDCAVKTAEVKGTDTAFIQFSSGSTGDPKGVVITHKNVLANLGAVLRWADIGSNDIGLNWMPLTHDMGLIGTHIKGVLACMNQYNIETALFIRHPVLWIQKACEHRATLLYSPNFGYKHFLSFFKPEVKKDWNLSSVRLIFNGAEPISVDLCNEFSNSLSQYGLRKEAMYPVYGLAEGTIAVTFPHPGEELKTVTLNRDCLKIGDTVSETGKEDIKACTFVEVGYPIYECSVRICDSDNNELEDNRIGYICIGGASVTSGYYNNKEATLGAITADGWLNTGDLGFKRNGRLVITGRAKDVIFIKGQNYYSHDIERITEEVEGIDLGKVAAVGAFNERLGSDELIVFVLFKSKVEKFIDVVQSVKRVISEKTGIEVSEVIPVRSIPKTTSGKVQRYKLRESYIGGEYDSLRNEIKSILKVRSDNREIILPENELQERTARIWQEVLGIGRADMKDNFFQSGGDSLKATQLISRIREEFGVEVQHAELFTNPELEKLTGIIAQTGRCTGTDEIIEHVHNRDSLPLSSAQQRLWFLERLNEGSTQYNLYSGLCLQGSLNSNFLVKSLNKIIERHEILRTSFMEEDGQPVQVVSREIRMELPLIDLTDIPKDERKKTALSLAEKEAEKPFNLKNSPLMRGKLFRTDENEHILVLSAHHIIFDGWSFKILLKELESCYQAYVKGKEPELPPLKIQYPDYARWQKKRLLQDNIRRQVDYWKEKLNGKLPVTDLPVAKKRPAVQTYEGARFTGIIPDDISKRLRSTADMEGVTLYMLLLAAFKVLLYKYTGQEEIIVGSPVANRNRVELESLIGFFTNNLVIRTGIDAKSSFRELLKTVRDVTLEAYANQDVPFEKIVEELNLPRDMSRNPLFQVFFSLQDTPLPQVELPGLSVSGLNIDGGTSRFDISVDINDRTEDLEVNFEYNTNLFNSGTIARMAGHYSQVLKNILENPEQEIDKIEILTSQEREMILRDWNDTYMDFEKDLCWVRLFEEQAGKCPDAVAVVCGDEQMTYGELNKRANQLANYLISSGVGPETVVGIYIDRSFNMVMALLGVHKAGGAYLPMDPVFPKERLEYMAENARVPVILTDKSLMGTLPEHSARVICMDESWDEISVHGHDNPECTITPGSLAYVIYTSGSTGKPKGVQIEHHALVNFLLSMRNNTQITGNDVLLAVTTLSFDIAGLEMFLPLVSGARVVIAGRSEVIDGQKLAELLNRRGVTLMQATPATWRMILESGWSGNRNLRILCGGEALPEDLANRLMDKGSCLWNVYGPTETTIWSTMVRLDSAEGTVPIGKPIANTGVYILDRNMRPTPVGVPGELYIGGSGLARGYLWLPELTDEKFVPNPFSDCIGSRIYKTGDLARFMPDGNIEFIGRMDHQVKLRGFRIELGEIEAVLNRHEMVSGSVVVIREVMNGEKALVAYVVPQLGEDGDQVDPGLLREYLKGKLPDYMIPSFFVTLNAFPMTPNGKIDRKSLPIPENTGAVSHASGITPLNDIQKAVAGIWKDVLGRDDIGVNRNFFDIGGHSLLLARVRSKISKIMDIEIQIMDLFKYPTIEALSNFIEERKGGKTAETEVTSRHSQIDSEDGDIAVVGLSARVPGARNIDEFWKNLCDAKESITRLSDEEIIEAGVDSGILKNPDYVKAWGVLEDADKFDAHFFGYNPREAKILDPQQRIFLEEAWKALENAGYDPEKFKGSVGTFASVGMNTYVQNLSGDNESGNVANNYQIMINNDKDFLATRVAYKLNLEGPGITVQTACSSSMVAVHLACRSLINGECDMALAGGVSVRLPQKSGYLYQEGMILSPDGHCRAFDEKAGGTVGGNGTGIVVLKRLKDAIADGDCINAVIKGTAVNNDGSLKIGYTAPGIEGQAKVITEAQKTAGVSPETITYIEAHGTGTPLGDPIELEALNRVFSAKNSQKSTCAIGSVKTNIGHLDAAAGVMGLIKAVLALKNKKIPPSINFEKPNPKFDFDNSCFYVNTALKDWMRGQAPLRAGVSSFGIGGTNAHAVLEEAPAKNKSGCNDSRHLLIFSAKTNRALNRMTSNMAVYLKENPGIDMGDVAFTLKVGRREFECRSFAVCTTREEAIRALESNSLISASVSGPGKIYDEADLKAYSHEELGHFWLQGFKIDWNRLYEGQTRYRIPLPTYPFEGQSYWAEANGGNTVQKTKDKAKRKADILEFFYAPIWKQTVLNIPAHFVPPESMNKTCLVLMNENSFENTYINRLKSYGMEVLKAAAGSMYRKNTTDSFTFNPVSREDYDALLNDLKNMGKVPDVIINMLGITGDDDKELTENRINNGKRLFYSMLFMAKAIGKQEWGSETHIKVLTDNMQKVLGERRLYPEKALVLGPCKVIPREYPGIKCTSLDFILPEKESSEEQELMEQLIYETCRDSSDTVVAYRSGVRLIRDFEKMKPENGSKPAIEIKRNGTYLITGGLGGIGLTLAEYLAKKEKVRLVLVGRSSFPGADNWDQWIETHGQEDKTSLKIKELKKIRGLGTEIAVCQADVNDIDQVKKLRDSLEQSFGKINGIVHAAGIPGGGMIQLKNTDFVENVFAPKVTGTCALYEIFKDPELDFFIMSSSLNAVTGGFGQVDYSAANNFMDAFAVSHDSRHGTRLVSINWDRWPGVGMASGFGVLNNIKAEIIHPLLGRKVMDTPGKTVYLSVLSPKKDWVLSEHLVAGTPTIAGTTYLEMVRAAFEDINGDKGIQLADVTFLAPMAVKDSEEQEVLTILERNEAGFDFKVVSRIHSQNHKDNLWQEHVRGRVEALPDDQKKTVNIEEIKERCHKKIVDDFHGQGEIKEDFISFGKRWRALKGFSLCDHEGIAEVELSHEFIEDLKHYKMHPALLDVATGSVRLANNGNYLPFSYEKMAVKDMPTDKIYACIRFKEHYNALNEIITCDIDIVSDNGTQLVEIKNFSMRLISAENALNIKTGTANTHSMPEYTEICNNYRNSEGKGIDILDEGITVEEGREIFGKILSGHFNPQVVISVKDIDSAIEYAGYINRVEGKLTGEPEDTAKTLHPRPELSSAYTAPKSESELKLAKIWQQLLGIDGIGIHDEFFELGGDSLLLVQFHSKVKEVFKTDIAVVDLYKYNTIALLAKQIDGESAEVVKPDFGNVNRRVNKQLDKIKQKRQRVLLQRGRN